MQVPLNVLIIRCVLGCAHQCNIPMIGRPGGPGGKSFGLLLATARRMSPTTITASAIATTAPNTFSGMDHTGDHCIPDWYKCIGCIDAVLALREDDIPFFQALRVSWPSKQDIKYYMRGGSSLLPHIVAQRLLRAKVDSRLVEHLCPAETPRRCLC